jgi:hypothetical protein
MWREVRFDRASTKQTGVLTAFSVVPKHCLMRGSCFVHFKRRGAKLLGDRKRAHTIVAIVTMVIIQG